MKALITGGAGYIGTTLIPRLQDSGYKVTVFDSLLHGGDALLPFFRDVNFRFIKGDIRDVRALKEAVRGQDLIVHLAALVGAPACEKDTHTAYTVNSWATNTLAQTLSPSQRMIYASTVSVYGKSDTKECTEESPLDPQSTYGKSKLEAEGISLSYGHTALRFGTVFGISPRQRLDLVINDLVYNAVKTGAMMVYEPNFVRPWVSVTDAARAIVWAADTYQKEDVLNVVSRNTTKMKVAEIIQEDTVAEIFVKAGSDADKRDYSVAANRIQSKGFRFSIDFHSEIRKMIEAFRAISVPNHFKNV
jgi:nucleoside-diphosphate-sugar epimerase